MLESDPLLAAAQPVTKLDYNHVRLRRQWVVVAGGDSPQVDWPSIQLGGRHRLWHHHDARVLQVNRFGSSLVLVGVPLYEAGRESLLADLRTAGTNGGESIPRFLERLSGTYVLFHADDAGVTLYTDPAGMMTVFRGRGRVASTPTLLGELERNRNLDEAFPFGRRNDWYPGDLTPFKDVRAVLPNHALDIESGRSWRFWPTRDAPRLEFRSATEALAALIQGNVDATVEQGLVLCSVTGGKDSRVNVAALKTHLDEAAFFTVSGEGIAKCDIEIPDTIARFGGLNHRFLPNCPAPEGLDSAYDEMTHGLSIGGRRDIIGAVEKIAGKDRIHISGALGPVAKGTYWHSKSPTEIRKQSLFKYLADTPPEIEDALERWLSSVPSLAPATTYNLMYLEQRVGRWGAIGHTASALFFDSVSPLCSRRAFEIVSGAPFEQQFKGRLLEALVAKMWPGLADLPYCRRLPRWSRRVGREVRRALPVQRGSA